MTQSDIVAVSGPTFLAIDRALLASFSTSWPLHEGVHHDASSGMMSASNCSNVTQFETLL